jgi:peptide/nickel transport system substrate-binding protein
MKAVSRALLGSLLILALVACVPASGPDRQQGESGPQARRGEAARPLVIIVRVEPASVAGRALQQAGTSLHVPRRIFNALLALVDGDGLPRPDLAEALPQLNTESWHVFPDGRMETTHRLKPNLSWHDGTPVSAEDFVFAARVYRAPEHGHADRPPFHAMEEITAPDARTILVRWRLPYAGADSLSARDRELPPLPRHVLRESFEQQSAEAFGTHPFWTREYIGVGPFKIENWEPGAFIEAVAFDGYALGRPKIDRIRIHFVSDSNTAMANLLSGESHVATDNSIAQVVDALKGDWAQRTGGKLVHWPNAWRHTAIQQRPELANPRAILDARLRKALAHAIDKESINESVLGGDGILSETMIWARSEWGAATERLDARYPFDLRRTEQLMGEAGFQKGADGFYTGPGGRFTGGLRTTAAADFEAEMLIMADTWRRAGFEIQESVLPAAQAQDNQVRATFPTLFNNNTNMGESAMLNYTTSGIPRPENRWNGGNRGGWANADYDRLAEEFNRTLERSERVQQVAEMLRIYAEELPAISLFFRAQPLAHIPALRGPATAAPESSLIWNVHEWEFR